MAGEQSHIAAQLLLAAASAAQPAQRSADPEQPNAPVSDQDSSELHESSAARPASELNAYAEPRSLQDCSAWLDTIPAQEIAPNQPLLRLHSALAVLQKRPSRQQREEVKRLLDPWRVLQKARKRKRSHDEVKAELSAAVTEETRRLKRMQGASDTAGARFSAITASSQNASARH